MAQKSKAQNQIPLKTSDLIPVREIYEDGIFELASKEPSFSITYRFSDINYTLSSAEEKREIARSWGDVLNSADISDIVKVTTITRRVERDDFADSLFIPLPKSPGEKNAPFLDIIEEYDKILASKTMNSENKVRTNYITVTTFKKNVKEARAHFAQVFQKLSAQLNRGILNSTLYELSAEERLQIFYDFYHSEQDPEFNYDLETEINRGHDSRDYIAPLATERIDSATYCFGDKYCRSFFLSHYATYIDDDIIVSLSDIGNNTITSLDYYVVPTDEAIKTVDRILLDIGTDKINRQRKMQEKGFFSATTPYSIEQNEETAMSYHDALTEEDQSMMICTITVCLQADSLEELNSISEALISKGQEKRCDFSRLVFQQREGYMQVLPYGGKYIEQERTLTTEEVAGFIPFSVEEIMDGHGIYCGQNLISRNPIMVDQTELQNGNAFVFGTAGSGKSMTMKQMILQDRLREDADIIIIDPEREYADVVKMLEGETVYISPTSKTHINAMDITTDEMESGDDFLKLKSDFVMSFCELVHTNGNSNMPPLGASERSIIDEAVRSVYSAYFANGGKGEIPTLNDLRNYLLLMGNESAKTIAIELGLYTEGSLNTFSKQTNVDTDASLLCYDIQEIGSGLQAIGMLVVLDAIFNRIARNRWKKRKTYVFIDEIYLLFKDPMSADYLYSMWKRVRKYAGFMTGATQNVSDMLQSHTAQDMLGNSEFVVLLNQNQVDIPDLIDRVGITDEQISYIRNVESGHGLMKIGKALVPFENTLPTNSSIFKQMTTKIVGKV